MYTENVIELFLTAFFIESLVFGPLLIAVGVYKGEFGAVALGSLMFLSICFILVTATYERKTEYKDGTKAELFWGKKR